MGLPTFQKDFMKKLYLVERSKFDYEESDACVLAADDQAQAFELGKYMATRDGEILSVTLIGEAIEEIDKVIEREGRNIFTDGVILNSFNAG